MHTCKLVNAINLWSGKRIPRELRTIKGWENGPTCNQREKGQVRHNDVPGHLGINFNLVFNNIFRVVLS